LMKFQYPHVMCSSLLEFHRKPFKSFMKKKEKNLKFSFVVFFATI